MPGERFTKTSSRSHSCDGFCEACNEELEDIHFRDRKEKHCLCKNCAEEAKEEAREAGDSTELEETDESVDDVGE